MMNEPARLTHDATDGPCMPNQGPKLRANNPINKEPVVQCACGDVADVLLQASGQASSRQPAPQPPAPQPRRSAAAEGPTSPTEGSGDERAARWFFCALSGCGDRGVRVSPDLEHGEVNAKGTRKCKPTGVDFAVFDLLFPFFFAWLCLAFLLAFCSIRLGWLAWLACRFSSLHFLLDSCPTHLCTFGLLLFLLGFDRFAVLSLSSPTPTPPPAASGRAGAARR